MVCQVCKQSTATVHLTEITDGQRSEMHMCEECAQKQGVSIKNQIPLNELLSTLLSQQSHGKIDFGQSGTTAAGEGLSCPSCGMSWQDFGKVNLLGCPEDYDVFADQLMPLVQQSHSGAKSHCGKIPGYAPEDLQKQNEMTQLRRQLEQAVSNEDYETAARLRDQIRQLEQ